MASGSCRIAARIAILNRNVFLEIFSVCVRESFQSDAILYFLNSIYGDNSEVTISSNSQAELIEISQA